MKHTFCSYGYKVYSHKQGKTHYIRRFKAYTYKQAVCARKTLKNTLKKHKWKTMAIKRKEVKDGIWRETPF